MNEGLSVISELIQADAAVSEETAAAAEELDAQVVTLQEKLSYFKTRSSSNSMLRKAWIDASLYNTDLGQLQGVSSNKSSYEPGDIILKEGDESNGKMYFVMNGHVEVYKGYREANEIFLATLKPMDIFGEMSVFLSVPRSATIVAREKLELMELDQQNMHEFLSTHPKIAFDFIATLCTRMQNMLGNLDLV